MEDMDLRNRNGMGPDDGQAQDTAPAGGAPRKRTALLAAALVLVVAVGALAYKQLGSGVTGASPVQTAAAAAPAAAETLAGGETVAAETPAGGETVAAETAGKADAAGHAGETGAGNAAGEASAAPAADGAEAPETAYAPDFTVYDAAGDPVRLSDFRGTPVVLNFWASWCPPCRSEMPDFDEGFGTYSDRVQFVMVNLTDGTRETVKTASDFIEKQGYLFPVYFDTDMDAAYTYGVSSIPTSYFIDADGVIAAWGMGALSAENLEEAIKMILP